MPPTCDSIGIGRCPLIFSTTRTCVPLSTPSCTVVRVAWYSSWRNGRTASGSPGGAGRGIGNGHAWASGWTGPPVGNTGGGVGGLEAARRDLGGGTGAQVHPFVSDVAGPGSAERTVKEVGPVDVLVLNAGGPPPGR